MQMIGREPHEVLGGFEHFESAIIVAFIAAVGIGLAGAIWTLLLVLFTKDGTRGSVNTERGAEFRRVSKSQGSSRIHKWSSGPQTYSHCDRKKFEGARMYWTVMLSTDIILLLLCGLNQWLEDGLQRIAPFKFRGLENMGQAGCKISRWANIYSYISFIS